MYIPVNGITLHAEVAGAGQPLLLLHGFTGSAATWRALAARLAPGVQAIAVDLIGHGHSDAPDDPARYSMAHCVADLLALLDTLGLAQTSVLGYSLGGRVALQLAAAAPARVGALLLASTSPGLASTGERMARAAADDALADTIERDGLEAFVDHWERLPLWASQATLPAETRAGLRAQRLRNRPRGLANSLRGMGTGRQTSLWGQLSTLEMPALLLAGALDTKYAAIARHMADTMPRANLAIVPGTGHAIHLEQPGVFVDHVIKFLQ